jgi:DME family drug/metabolite transporter
MWAQATAVAVAGGVVLVAAQGGSATLDVVGLLCAVAAGASYAVYAVAIKTMIERGVGSTVAMAGAFSVGAVLLAPFGLTQPLGWLDGIDGVVMVLWLGIATVGVAYAWYGYGLRFLPTSTAVTLTLAEPVTAAVLGVVVLDEHLPALGWVGAGLVVVGLALTARRPVTPVPE